jgi:septum formation inhibitor MinC
MGMSADKLNFQIQQETQRAIVTLQNNMKQLDRILQVIDGNMRQSHTALLQDITRLTVRVNFLLDEAKNGKTEEEAKDVEARFKTFAENAQTQMQKEVAEMIRMKEKFEEDAKKAVETGGPGSENTPNVLQ